MNTFPLIINQPAWLPELEPIFKTLVISSDSAEELAHRWIQVVENDCKNVKK